MYILTTLEFRKHNIDLESVVFAQQWSVQCYTKAMLLGNRNIKRLMYCRYTSELQSSPLLPNFRAAD